MTGSTQMTVAGSVLSGMRKETASGHPLLKEKLLPVGAALHMGFSDMFMLAWQNEGLSAAGAPQNGSQPSASRVQLDVANDYCFALEYIFEGYLLHYGSSRLLALDALDFCLLAGDYMYALGLKRIAGLGDPACIRMFADLVSVCAFIRCESTDAGAALGAWTAATLCLAGHAAALMPKAALRLSKFKESVWSRPPAAGLSLLDAAQMGTSPADASLQEILNPFPAETQSLLHAMASDIYSVLVANNARRLAV